MWEEAGDDAGDVEEAGTQKQTKQKKQLLPFTLGVYIGKFYIYCRPLLAGTGIFAHLLLTTEARKKYGGA